MRGFKPRNKQEYHLVNVEALNRFQEGETVSPETLVEKGVLRKIKHPVKILGRGQLRVKLTVRAHAFSRGAVEKIEAAGGTAEVI